MTFLFIFLAVIFAAGSMSDNTPWDTSKVKATECVLTEDTSGDWIKNDKYSCKLK